MLLYTDNSYAQLQRAFGKHLNSKPLSQEEEFAMIKDLQNDWTDAKFHKFVYQYSQLLLGSCRFASKQTAQPADSFLSVAFFAMEKALRKFDTSFDARFATYYLQWFRSTFFQEISISKARGFKLSLTALKYIATFYSRNKELPTDEELKEIQASASTSISISLLESARTLYGATHISFDSPIRSHLDSDEDLTLSNVLADESITDPLDKFDQEDAALVIEKALEDFRHQSSHGRWLIKNVERAIEIFRGRHLREEPLTFDQLGRYYNISGERARQIESKVVSHVSSSIRSNKYKKMDFLL